MRFRLHLRTVRAIVSCELGNIKALQVFTGIITDIGTIVEMEQRGDLRVRIKTSYAPDTIDLGASIACDGVCLTVIERGTDTGGGHWFDVEASAETVGATAISTIWSDGAKINLERALRLGDELGGHLVSGHVDGVADVIATEQEGDSTKMTLRAPKELEQFIAAKGSVTLNGTSLTVNTVHGREFEINLIPHTKQNTTWGLTKAGDPVNIEIDTLARYVARLYDLRQQ